MTTPKALLILHGKQALNEDVRAAVQARREPPVARSLTQRLRGPQPLIADGEWHGEILPAARGAGAAGAEIGPQHRQPPQRIASAKRPRIRQAVRLPDHQIGRQIGFARHPVASPGMGIDGLDDGLERSFICHRAA